MNSMNKSLNDFTLIEFPSFASATASFSFKSLDTIFFKTFFKFFDNLPSTAAVAAKDEWSQWSKEKKSITNTNKIYIKMIVPANASVVSLNFSKCFNFNLETK